MATVEELEREAIRVEAEGFQHDRQGFATAALILMQKAKYLRDHAAELRQAASKPRVTGLGW